MGRSVFHFFIKTAARLGLFLERHSASNVAIFSFFLILSYSFNTIHPVNENPCTSHLLRWLPKTRSPSPIPGNSVASRLHPSESNSTPRRPSLGKSDLVAPTNSSLPHRKRFAPAYWRGSPKKAPHSFSSHAPSLRAWVCESRSFGSCPASLFYPLEWFRQSNFLLLKKR